MDSVILQVLGDGTCMSILAALVAYMVNRVARIGERIIDVWEEERIEMNIRAASQDDMHNIVRD